MYEIVIGRDQKDKEKYGTKGAIFLGKQYVTMGQTTSVSNSVYMDMVRSHVVLVAGKRGCLEGTTLIFTDKGYKKIKEFDETEDKILSFNKKEKIFEWESAKLLHYPIKNEKVLTIILSNEKSLTLTKEHPLLVAVGTNQLSLLWRPAEELKEDDMLLCVTEDCSDINPITIKKIEWREGVTDVYDLTVPKNHSFIANGIISHNSGKSYTLGVVAEGMADLPPEIKQNLTILLLDTMGVYWTMKYPNKKELPELKEWGLEPKGLDVQIYTPTSFFEEYRNKGIPTDFPFAIQPNELTPEDWCITFDVNINEPIGVLIERAINTLREQTKEEGYSVQEIIGTLDSLSAATDIKDAAKNRFYNTLSWGIFDKKGTRIEDLAQAGKVGILDVSCYATMPNGWKIKCLVVGLVCKKLFMQRMLVRKDEEFAQLHESMRYFSTEQDTKQEFPLVWVVVDEAHEFLPREGKTTASDPLITILREGRQPGISLILATQQPGKIHTDVMTQSDTVLSHRITAKIDTEALGTLMQSYMREGLDVQLDNLPRTKGS
ncbi:MAG: DUF87 domain-containing protein, partial [Nanoarchaeota archaeon]